MTGSTSSIDGVLVYFLTHIIPNIFREPTRKSLVDIYRTLSSNVVSIASNLDGGRHGYLELTMAADNYLSQTGHTFDPPHNMGDYQFTMFTMQE